MSTYTIVTPNNYTQEHVDYIEKYTWSTKLLSAQTNLMIFLRDVNSKFIIGTAASATKFGLKNGNDFAGKLISDLPCRSVAMCANQIKQQEYDLLQTLDISKIINTLNVFEFADGLKARIGQRRIFFHQKSASILGVISVGSDAELKDFVNIIPNYILRFGALGNLESINQHTVIDNSIVLSDYEQEICFLFLLGWDCTQIANFMNEFRPNKYLRNSDTIAKKKHAICQKFALPTDNLAALCEYLVAVDFHKKLPQSFYSRIIGTRVID